MTPAPIAADGASRDPYFAPFGPPKAIRPKRKTRPGKGTPLLKAEAARVPTQGEVLFLKL